jgi:alginate O-acetyltransferase complex protein AlgI
MLFNSASFLVFFPVVLILYFAIPFKWRNVLLLLASWYFYMSWKFEYIILIILSTSIDYFAGLKIEQTGNKKVKKRFLIVSLVGNLGILFFFKYFGFFFESFTSILNNSEWYKNISHFDILLPIGISFYTFQSMSYTIGVYRNKTKAEQDFIKFALYVSFFPQLVAGPIERAGHLLKQFGQKYVFDYQRVSYGLKLMFWGFFQKVVIADNISRFVDVVFENPASYFGWDIILVSILFSIQIYADFSGYTDIARGAAKIMGYELMINFRRPYFASSIRDFWKRWHITLSTWFKDYVYISLGGNRVNKMKWMFAIIATFALSGLWHGANWTFALWGVYHAFLYLAEYLINSKFKINLKNNRVKVVRILLTFGLVIFGWMLFRAKSVNDFLVLIDHLFSSALLHPKISFDRPSLLIIFLSTLILLAVWIIEIKKDIVSYISEKPKWVRYGIYYFASLYLIGFGNWGVKAFIYFQF